MEYTKCSSCGVDLPGAPAPAKCSECVQKERAEMDHCAECGRLFLARTSADNFYCDDCYSSPAYPFDNEHYRLDDVYDE